MRYLGNISFSFYLVHGFAIEITMYSNRSLFAGLDGVTLLLETLLPTLALSVLFATVLYVLAERPYFYFKPVAAPQIPIAHEQPAG